MLELENVTKVYRVGAFGKGSLRAVDRACFSIGPGEVCSLIGESGSGKSTLGKMILKLSPVSSGTIRFEEEDITTISSTKQLKEYYRKVQGVFQDPFSSFNPIFKADRVFHIIHREFFPKVADQDWEKRVHDSLRSVGINPGEVLHKFPHQLSGGQLQRLLIARALLLDVKVLVADEIISMLDASTRIDVLNLLALLKKKGLCVLFITHDLSLGYYISDKAVILYKGVVVETGTTDAVFLNPVHPYTRKLLKAVPRLDMKWEDVELEAPRGEIPELFIPGETPGACTLQQIHEGHFVAVPGGE
ncbi:MAG TPA: ATP-binding cassette domain-containing protein [Thermotogota bacterium]|nr:ATP-binding cassette domain-containing protein [Thermotogota bacterium]HRW93635.1 ATP-binding cassette domain-containing protein [Thermotogota bacterium]